MRTKATRGLFALLMAACMVLAALPATAAEGLFDVELELDSSLDALSNAIPGLRQLNGAAHIHIGYRANKQGGQVLRDRVVTITSADARLGRLPLGALSAVLTSPGDGSRSSVVLDASGPLAATVHLEATIDLEVDIDDARVAWKGGAIDGALRVEGVNLSGVTDAYPVLALEGVLDVHAKVSGSAKDPTFEGYFGARDVTYRTEHVGTLVGRVSHASSVSSLDFLWGTEADPVLLVKGRLPLAIDLPAGEARWLDDQPMELDISAPAVTPRRLQPFWYAPGGLDFNLGVAIAVGGSLDALATKATLRGWVQSGTSGHLAVVGDASASSTEQALSLKVGAGVLDLRLAAKVPFVDLRRGGGKAESAPLTGTLRSTLLFPLLVPFLPDDLAEPTGALETALAIAGTVGAPSFSGDVTTKGAEVTLLSMQQRLTDVTLEAKAAGDTLTVTRLSGKMGLGRLAGRGTLKFQPTPKSGPPESGLWSLRRLAGGLALEAHGVPLLQDGMPIGKVELGTQTTLVVTPGDVALDTTITTGHALIYEPTLYQPSSIAKNPSVHELDALGDVRPGQGFLAGTGHMLFRLKLAKPFEVIGASGRWSLAGALTVDRRGTIVKVDGGFDVQKGSRFDLFDNAFDVLSGRVTLLGGEVGARKGVALQGGSAQATLADPDQPIRAEPLDVVVDVLAEGEAVDTRVAVEIRGPWRRPELLLGSDPELPEYQILTLLITGRVDSIDDSDGEVRRKVAALVQRFHQPALGRQLLDKLGVDKIGIGFGASASEPILTIGKQVNKKLYVETVYHHNAPPDANAREGRAELRVGPRVTIDTAFGDAAAGAAGVHYRVSFGGPARAKLGDTISLFGKSRLPTDSDSDGIADEVDKCPLEAEDQDGYQDADGCVDRDNDGDGVVDERDAAPDVAETKNGYRDGDGAADERPTRLTWLGGKIRTLELAPSSARLTDESQQTLEVAAGVLEDFADLAVDITGHSDDRGTERLIQALSETRAKSVRDFLVARGLSGERATASGKGASEPVDPAPTPEARAKNRRVEMRLLKAAPKAEGAAP